MEMEHTNPVEWRLDYVNKELVEFGYWLMVNEETTKNIQTQITCVREIAQATLGCMDEVPRKLASVCSNLQEKIQWTVDQAIFGLKSQNLMELDEEITLLETQMELSVMKCAKKLLLQ